MSCNNQATGSWDCTVRLWPLTDGKMNNTCLKGHRSNIHAVAFSSNSLLVSTCTVFFLLVTKCKSNYAILLYMSGADPGEVKRVNFHPPFSESPCFFFFLIPQILIGSNTLLQKFTAHFKILDPRLA